MKLTKTGIKNEPMDAYLADRAFGNSTIFAASKSLAHAYAAMTGWGKSDTPSTTLGTMFHEYTTQPHLFERNYIRWGKLPNPDADLRNAANRDFAKEIKTEGKQIVKEEQYVALNNMRSIVQITYPDLFKQIASDLAIIEHSVYATTDEGIGLKIRPDILIDNGDHILSIDIKTADNCHPEKFYYHCRDFGYLYSATYYPWIIGEHFQKPVKHLYLCVETKPPHNCVVYDLNSVAIDFATLTGTIERLAKAVKLNSYPGYARKNQILEL